MAVNFIVMHGHYEHRLWFGWPLDLTPRALEETNWLFVFLVGAGVYREMFLQLTQFRFYYHFYFVYNPSDQFFVSRFCPPVVSLLSDVTKLRYAFVLLDVIAGTRALSSTERAS